MSNGRYAVVSSWSFEPGRMEEQQRGLHEQVMPLVRQHPGFVAGYWTLDRSNNTSFTTIVLEDEEAARRFHAVVEGHPANREQAGVRLESLAVVEVIGEAYR